MSMNGNDAPQAQPDYPEQLHQQQENPQLSQERQQMVALLENLIVQVKAGQIRNITGVQAGITPGSLGLFGAGAPTPLETFYGASMMMDGVKAFVMQQNQPKQSRILRAGAQPVDPSWMHNLPR